MIDPNSYPVRLVGDIARQIDQLTEHLIQADPSQTTRILAKILDSEEGLLGRLTSLLATGATVSKKHARAGTFSPEVCLALGRSANDLNDLDIDLDEYRRILRRLAQGTPPAPTAAGPSAATGRRR